MIDAILRHAGGQPFVLRIQISNKIIEGHYVEHGSDWVAVDYEGTRIYVDRPSIQAIGVELQ